VTAPTESTPGGMSAPTIGATEGPRRFHDFTIASGIVFTFAIATVLSLPFSKMSHQPHEPMPLVFALPHLSIVALMAAGFRRRGDIVAWILAMPCLFIFAILAFLSGLGGESNGDVALVKITLFQLIIVLAAGADLARNKKLTPQPVALRNRWIGLVVPAVVLLATSALTNNDVRERENQIQQTEDSTGAEATSRAAAWLSDPMIDNVVRIARCVEQFRGDSIAGPAPKSLQEVYCADSSDLHHLVYYEPPKNLRGDPFHRAPFTLGIEAVWDSAAFPDASGRPGTRSYFLDAGGEIHVTAEHRRATVADPVVPACSRHDGEIPYHVECRPPFESRERWGVVHDLPRFSIHVDHFDSPDSVLASFSFHQVSAFDSVRVSIDWGEGHAPTVMNIKPTQSITRIEVISDTAAYTHQFEPSVFYRYSTLGRKVVTAKLVTRAGDEYVATDTVNIAWVTRKSRKLSGRPA
jgi:hypothetical protein